MDILCPFYKGSKFCLVTINNLISAHALISTYLVLYGLFILYELLNPHSIQ